MQRFYKITLLILTVIITGFFLSGKDDNTVPGWPEITNVSKPWTRWWWQGSSVDSLNLTKNMEKYAKAGLGGIELTTIYGVKGLENEFVSFGSEKWMNLFSHTLSEAKRLDLGVDMALASGWPFGGPWVTPADACKYLQLKTYKLKAGQVFTDTIFFIEKPLVRTVGKRIDIKNISDPISSNDSLQFYAFDQVRFPRKLPLASLMAFSEKGETVDITSYVQSDGTLSWIPGAGNWTFVAAFSGWHGKMVERAGPGGEGDVIDHFSKKATLNYLKRFDEFSNGYDLSGLRAFFNDSYEVDDAFGESNWTPEFFEKFKTKRGYDLRNHLLILVGEDCEEKRRVVCDFRETISDLLLEEFTIPWKEWSASKGKIIRNQSHGSPANILDLYAASDIPETEGTDILNIKFASSAAHICGKHLVAAEACTWLNEHFLSNLADAKENVDRYLTGGVNHIVYHGTPYSPENEPWPGRMFYASEHFAPTNPQWSDFKALNEYIARVQSFLQRGKVQNEILLYFPIHDQWMEPGKSNLYHFHGAEPSSSVYKLADTLQKQGYSFDFISDKQITELTVSDYNIKAGDGASFKTIIIPETEFIPFSTFKELIALSNQGAKIIYLDQLPQNVPGLGSYLNYTKQMQELAQEINLVPVKPGIKEAKTGKGSVVLGSNPFILLEHVSVLREKLVDKGLEFIRLADGPTEVYFITNWSQNTIDGYIPFNTKKANAIIYNPKDGSFGSAQTNNINKNAQQVYLQLKRGESCIVQFWSEKTSTKAYQYWQPVEGAISLPEGWKLEFIEGGPAFPETYLNTSLISWTNLPGDKAKYFSGTAVYSIHFSKPDKTVTCWELQLGEVYESAKIVLNGKVLRTLIGPVYNIEIEAGLLQEDNLLEIKVSNLMANRIIYMDKEGINYRKFYNVNFAARLKENQGTDGKFSAKNWTPLKSGLIGPVKLVPLENKFKD